MEMAARFWKWVPGPVAYNLGVRRFAYNLVWLLCIVVYFCLHAEAVIGFTELHGVWAGLVAFVFVGVSDVAFLVLLWDAALVRYFMLIGFAALAVLSVLRIWLDPEFKAYRDSIRERAARDLRTIQPSSILSWPT